MSDTQDVLLGGLAGPEERGGCSAGTQRPHADACRAGRESGQRSAGLGAEARHQHKTTQGHGFSPGGRLRPGADPWSEAPARPARCPE